MEKPSRLDPRNSLPLVDYLLAIATIFSVSAAGTFIASYFFYKQEQNHGNKNFEKPFLDVVRESLHLRKKS